VQGTGDEQRKEGDEAMVKKVLAVGLTVLVAVVILFGVVAYSYLKPAEAASGPIQTTAIAQTAAGRRPM
jgi:hypothetical protein